MDGGMLLVLLFVWAVSAVVAGVIAGDRGRSGPAFAAVTFFFLGPLGPGFALVAPPGHIENPTVLPKRKVIEGRQRFACPRCGADNDIPNAATSYDCWRCTEHRNVKAKVASDA